MRTRLTLRAGRPGTRKLVKEYGERLLYVRYRYDDQRRIRVKTVEVIVSERPWTPPAAASGSPDPLAYVLIRFEPSDAATRTAVKRLGGYWHTPAKAWRITYAAVRLLHLEHLIVSEPSTRAEAEPSTAI